MSVSVVSNLGASPASVREELAVELREVTFSYPGATHPALTGVSLAVRAGESVVVAGESGSGKSTLARLVAGVQRATAGTVRTGALDPASARRHDLAAYAGLVFQNPNHQLFAATVRDELALGPRNLGLGRDEVADRVALVADRLHLATELDRHPYRLGMAVRKRVALAAVLAMRPHLLVLDEPTTGQGRREVAGIAMLLREEMDAGTTVITISHDMRLAAEIADRVVLLHGGRVVEDGLAREILGDDERMDAAGLEPPQIARLADRLGLARPDGAALTTDELLELLELLPGGAAEGPRS